MCDSEDRNSELQEIMVRLHHLITDIEQLAIEVTGTGAVELAKTAARLREDIAALIADGLNDNDEI